MPLYQALYEGLKPFSWLILEAIFDPFVIGIGLLMGWKANQFGKLVLAGLAAGLAGTFVTFFLRMLDISWFEGGYIFGGAHALFRIVAGYGWSVLAFTVRRKFFNARTEHHPFEADT